MSERLTVSDRIAAGFGVGAARELVIVPFRDAKLTIVHLCRFYEGGDDPVFLPPEDAFLVMLYLADVDHADIRPGGTLESSRHYPKGSICLISLKKGAAIAVSGCLEALVFHVPKAHLVELTAEAGEPQIDDLETCRGVDDPVVRNIGAALLPMFDMPEEVRDSLLAHVGLAFNAHLAHRYGRSPAQRLSASGRFSPLQEKRVRTFIAANLSRDIQIHEIADASGFSADEFRSGFLATTGQSVGEWLSARRVERAKAQLAKTAENMASIARACGFQNEHAFTDIFTRSVGMPPAAWRSSNRH
ncbi:AraC family transcriptional regulator [Pararhizobium gei]|uniref:AraC family transcriptional regulator n=1 Tax=Pararhizobium gei TaxID=1395951 RepID=UPI0023DBC1FC|nr:AraC family transcriptional regulator [Rhizobium gei]